MINKSKTESYKRKRSISKNSQTSIISEISSNKQNIKGKSKIKYK